MRHFASSRRDGFTKPVYFLMGSIAGIVGVPALTAALPARQGRAFGLRGRDARWGRGNGLGCLANCKTLPNDRSVSVGARYYNRGPRSSTPQMGGAKIPPQIWESQLLVTRRARIDLHHPGEVHMSAMRRAVHSFCLMLSVTGVAVRAPALADSVPF